MEYIMLLAMVVVLFIVVRATFGPVLGETVARITDRIEKKYFGPGNFHRFPR